MQPINVEPRPTTNDFLKDGVLYIDAPVNAVMVPSESDISEGMKQYYPAGTLFYTPGFKKIWQLDTNDNLVVML